MNKQSNSSRILIAVGILCFLLGGIAWVTFALIFTGYERLSVPVAAILAAIGATILIFNAIIHPESIPRPDVHLPEINVPPPEIGIYRSQPVNRTMAGTEIPGIINVDEWPIVRMFRGNNKPLTVKGQIRGTLCCLLWIATLAVYMLVSFYTEKWEITWVIFLGAAFIHTLIYALLSIGENKESTQE
jgi:hypothetical protein